MKNNLEDLSEELIKSIHSLDGFSSPLIEEELVRNLSEKLDSLTSEDSKERIKALHNMFALGQIFSKKKIITSKEEYLESIGFEFFGGWCKKGIYTIYFKEWDKHYMRIKSGNMQIFYGHVKNINELSTLLKQLDILNQNKDE